MSLIENSTCKIIVETQGGISEEKGTGFFISKNQILTCKHVIENLTGEIKIENCHNQAEQKLTAQIIDKCELTDYALLELIKGFESEYFLELCDSEIIVDEQIKIFGYPAEGQGQDTGEPLRGEVLSILQGNQTIQDVSLRIDGYDANTGYGGFSGSPVVNNYNQVISVVKYSAVRSLSAISIKKAKVFLDSNGINVKHDQIVSFDLFKNGVFAGFADRENECEVESNRPVSLLSPKLIIEKNKDELFYPKKNLELKDLISYLRKNKDLNDKLWKGWIQLLTYVEILKGDYSEANSISIKITSKEIYKQFGILNRTKDINVDLYLNFYLTEEKDYFKIAQKSIHENKKNQIARHTCNIFNSNFESFGNTNRFIADISNPEYSGPSIPNIKIGALSLLQLNRAVIDSNSLADVCNNLKKIFEDAIK
ncbi:S1 family peptidase [Myroides odoratimimus]|uniref:S1 family peptidase n=1 Tax=Myroides odoratimimus TaxID=76832 RepID=UPI0025771E74|nr:serine protease [Myroides odoratimimus]MDM1328668.1 trypsin-like peptidase domain-containing protein [Myroides odoratimimus]